MEAFKHMEKSRNYNPNFKEKKLWKKDGQDANHGIL